MFKYQTRHEGIKGFFYLQYVNKGDLEGIVQNKTVSNRFRDRIDTLKSSGAEKLSV